MKYEYLHFILSRLLANGNYNKAEDLLFKELEINKSQEIYELGQWFYNYLLNVDNKKLEKYNFPRKEIYQGLEELKIFKENYLIRG